MAFSERIARLKSSLIREILAAAQRPEVMSFAGGLPAEPMLPKVDWAEMPASMGQYGMSEGEPALREAIAAEARALGVPCDASQVLIVSGSQQTLDLASKLFIDPGTEVLLEAPTYLAALQAFQLFGADCISVPQEADGPELAALRQRLESHKPAFAYLIPTFQNPSATRYSEAKREAVAALLDEFGVTLIEDEPYRELVFDAGSATPIVSRLKKASWIYTGTVSKTLLPGLRVGYLIATPDLFPHLLRLKQSADLHTNRIGQWQALQWFGTEKYSAHLAELRDCVARMDQAIEQRLDKVGAQVQRDRVWTGELTGYWEQYKARAAKHAQEGKRDAQLTLYRWMLEEYRVSLFAQQLGTKMAVSDKRLSKQWTLVEG